MARGPPSLNGCFMAGPRMVGAIQNETPAHASPLWLQNSNNHTGRAYAELTDKPNVGQFTYKLTSACI